jgi:hypothetical protein
MAEEDSRKNCWIYDGKCDATLITDNPIDNDSPSSIGQCVRGDTPICATICVKCGAKFFGVIPENKEEIDLRCCLSCTIDLITTMTAIKGLSSITLDELAIGTSTIDNIKKLTTMIVNSIDKLDRRKKAYDLHRRNLRNKKY